MKKIKILILFLIPFGLLAQDTLVNKSGKLSPQKIILGTIANVTSFSGGITGFVDSASGWSQSGNNLLFSSGTGYSNHLGYNYASALNNVSITARIVLGTVSSSSIDVGLGMASINPYSNQSVLGRVSFSTAAGSKIAKIIYGVSNNYSTLDSAKNAVTASTGDVCFLTMTRSGLLYRFTVVDSNSNTISDTSFKVSIIYAGATPASSPNNTCYYSIYNLNTGASGNTFQLASMSITSTDIVGGTLFISDSRNDYGLLSENNMLTSQIGQRVSNLVANYGPGDRLVEMKLRFAEWALLKPTRVIIGPTGPNDVGSGFSLPTIEANYFSIDSFLNKIGATVIHDPSYSSGATQASYIAYIKSTYTTEQYIDGVTATQVTGATQVDATHLTTLGASLYSLLTINSLQKSMLINNILDFSNSIANSATTQPGSQIHTDGPLSTMGMLQITDKTNVGAGADFTNFPIAASYGSALFRSDKAISSSLFAISPNGGASTGGVAGWGVYNTDMITNPASYSFLGGRVISVNGNLGVVGTGHLSGAPIMNLMLSADYLTANSANLGQIFLKGSNGRVFVNDTTDGGTAQMQIWGTGAQMAWHYNASNYVYLNVTSGGIGQFVNTASAFQFAGSVAPYTNNAYTLGTSSLAWSNVYTSALTGTNAAFPITNITSLTLPTAALATGATTDSILTVTNSSGTSTVKAIANPVASGTYTPTLGNTTNIASSTLTGSSIVQVGSHGSIALTGNITPSGSGNVALTITYPTALPANVVAVAGSFSSSTDKVPVQWTSSSSSSCTVSFPVTSNTGGIYQLILQF